MSGRIGKSVICRPCISRWFVFHLQQKIYIRHNKTGQIKARPDYPYSHMWVHENCLHQLEKKLQKALVKTAQFSGMCMLVSKPELILDSTKPTALLFRWYFFTVVSNSCLELYVCVLSTERCIWTTAQVSFTFSRKRSSAYLLFKTFLSNHSNVFRQTSSQLTCKAVCTLDFLTIQSFAAKISRKVSCLCDATWRIYIIKQLCLEPLKDK